MQRLIVNCNNFSHIVCIKYVSTFWIDNMPIDKKCAFLFCIECAKLFETSMTIGGINYWHYWIKTNHVYEFEILCVLADIEIVYLIVILFAFISNIMSMKCLIVFHLWLDSSAVWWSWQSIINASLYQGNTTNIRIDNLHDNQ